jgi:hypothetical protein
VQAISRDPEADTLLREIILISREDTQLAYALLRLCYLTRFGFIQRNVGPDDLRDELRRLDATCLAALAAMMQEPDALELHCGEGADDWTAALAFIREPDWDGSVPVAFDAAAQQQARLRHKDGGLSIAALADQSAAAFAGRTYSVLQPVLVTLPAALAETHAPRLLGCPTLRQLQACVPALLEKLHIPTNQFGEVVPNVEERRKERLSSLLSEELVAWSTSQSEQTAAAFLATLFPQHTDAAAAASVAVSPTARLQADLSRLSNDTYKEAVRSLLCGIADE